MVAMTTNREPVGIGFDTRPIPMTITPDLTVHLLADPTNSDGWKALLSFEMPKGKDYSAQEKVRGDMTEALAEMAATPDDADKLRGAGLGLFTIAALINAYIREVTAGFPTQP